MTRFSVAGSKMIPETLIKVNMNSFGAPYRINEESLGQCKARPLKFVGLCLFVSFFLFYFSSAPTDYASNIHIQLERPMSKVHWPPHE